MSNGKSKVANEKSAPAPYKVQAAKNVTEPPPPVTVQPPLFRRIDWLAFSLTTLLVFIGYFLTLAPNLTLEDSGELSVGSYYAGIPHPPGYPFWTLWTYAFSHLVTVSNIAYRVGLASAIMGALASGVLAMIVSRGSSMMIEGIADLKTMDKRWENALCVVSGFVAGMFIGYNGLMWRWAVIVEHYSLSKLSLMLVLLALLRWVYAPHQRRYLYLALFVFGVCVTNHQTLLVAAMGVEIAIIAGQPKLGRDFLLGNGILWAVGLIAKSQHILTGMDGNPQVFFIFNSIGILSIIGCGWLAVTTKGLGTEWKVVLICGLLWLLGASFYFWEPIAGMSNPPMQWGYPRTVEGFFHALSRGQYEKTQPVDVFSDPLRYLGQIGILAETIVDEFNWVFALVALTPFFFFHRMQRRERAWLIGLFGIWCWLGLFLMALLNVNPDRQSFGISRPQLTGSHCIVAIFFGYGLTLIIAYMVTHYQKFRWPWGIIGGLIAAALALYGLASTIQTFYIGVPGSALANFFHGIGLVFAKNQYALPIISGLLLFALMLVLTFSFAFSRSKPMTGIVLAVFAIMPATAIMNNWSDSEQRGHLFGFWFGHDMFTPPFTGPDGKLSYDPKLRAEMRKDPEKAKLVYPEMAKDAVLYGGTDPGRFCPTYMIFDESFIPPSKKVDPNFDRRDVYIITQNALADGTYLMYIRAHYNRSTQYQYDTPFFQDLVRSPREKELNYTTNLVARMLSPLDHLFSHIGARIEHERRVGSSYFKDSDFTDLPGFAAKLQKHDPQDPLSSYLFENLSPDTQKLLAAKGDDSALRHALAKDLNVLIDRELLDKARIKQLREEQDSLNPETSEKDQARKKEIDTEIETLLKHGSLYDPNRFKNVKLPDTTVKFIAQNPQYDTRVRLNRLLLEAAYPEAIAKSKGGVYPDREIYIATPEDSQRCFSEYMADAQHRLQTGQLKPGEDVHVVDNRVQVSGQVAVMAINALLTKVMFDANPDHEFYVEESFPLDWMYPYLTPFGVIMKINRLPLTEISDDDIKRDHDFWSKYSERFIGNWITYDTSVKEICDFAEKVYIRHDYNGFKGDLKFVRDDQAQKAFSKLRSSIGGIYAWRINDAARKNDGAEQQRMIKEADFAFRQAFAFCPYSPEAVFRYIQLLANVGRIQDALLVAQTCQKLDPENGQIIGLVKNLTDVNASHGPSASVTTPLDKLEATYRDHPDDFQNALNLASACIQSGQTNRADEILQTLLDQPKADMGLVVAIANGYAQMVNYPKLEITLEKMVKISPEAPEAWYDLAALKAALHKNPEALTDLSRALELNDRHTNQTHNLRNDVKTDPRFKPLRDTPEFKKITAAPSS